MIACSFLVPYWILSIALSHAQATQADHSSSINIPVKEHRANPFVLVNATSNSTQKTLIRVTRFNEKSALNSGLKRSRRQLVEAIQTAGFVISVAKAMKNTETGEEILGMAKTVAIVIIVISSLCMTCCFITIVVICVKCCTRNRRQKREQMPTTIQVPQPIFVHAGPPTSPTQYYQQNGWNPRMMPTSPESRPMLTQPSAPPNPNDYIHTEHPPPPYEKVYQ